MGIIVLSEDREDATNVTQGDKAPEAYQINAVIQSDVLRHVGRLIKLASKLGDEAWTKFNELKAKAARDNLNEDNIPVAVRQSLSTSDYLIAPCVRILGNIVSGSDRQTAEVVKAGFYDVIELCIDHRIKNIKKESCWALSNVMAGTRDQLDLFFNRASLIKKVIELCRNSDLNVRKEAGWCLSNAICSAS